MQRPMRAGIAGLSLFALLFTACGGPSLDVTLTPTPTAEPNAVNVRVITTVTPSAANALSVSVASTTRGSIASTLVYGGSVQPDQQVEVAPRVSGRISKLKVEPGSQVKAGNVIATIGSSDLALDVVKAQAAYTAAVAHLHTMQAGARADTIAKAQSDLKIAEAKLATLKNGPRSEAVAQAKDNVIAAQAKLHAIVNGPRPESVAQAKDSFDSAQAKLNQLLAGPTSQQIAAAKISVEQAKNSLFAAQSQRDGNCNPVNPAFMCNASQSTVLAAEDTVAAAQLQFTILTLPPSRETLQMARAELDAAQQQYNLAQHPYTQDDITQAQAAVDAALQQYDLVRKPYTSQDVDQAQAVVDAAIAQLRLVQTPYEDDDFKTAQAAVDEAKASLDIAKAQLAEADVVAPFDGIVGRQLLNVGALTGPGQPIATLVSGSVGVTINVEESRLNFLSVGQEAKITVPAYPDTTFAATVDYSPQVIDPKARTGEVHLRVSDPKNLLKPGMYAQVSLLSARRQNVLLVPQSAIDTVNSQTVVYLVNDNTIKVQPVVVGLSNQTSAEIITGLSDGQVVAVGDKPALSDGEHVKPQPSAP
jgi:HlyD family secretion protein